VQSGFESANDRPPIVKSVKMPITPSRPTKKPRRYRSTSSVRGGLDARISISPLRSITTTNAIAKLCKS
jgi:hypothetical protein